MAQNTSPSHSAAIVLKSVQMFVHHLKALKLHKMVQIPDYCNRWTMPILCLVPTDSLVFIFNHTHMLEIKCLYSVAPRNMKPKPQWDLNQEPMDCWCHADYRWAWFFFPVIDCPVRECSRWAPLYASLHSSRQLSTFSVHTR